MALWLVLQDTALSTGTKLLLSGSLGPIKSQRQGEQRHPDYLQKCAQQSARQAQAASCLDGDQHRTNITCTHSAWWGECRRSRARRLVLRNQLVQIPFVQSCLNALPHTGRGFSPRTKRGWARLGTWLRDEQGDSWSSCSAQRSQFVNAGNLQLSGIQTIIICEI